MEHLLKTPEELLPYRPLRQVLASKGPGVHAVQPGDSVLVALQVMADKGIGFVVVTDGGKLVGVLSERDYARKVILAGRASKDTAVRDIMTRQVITVTAANTVPQCLALMDQNRFRHLPVVEGERVIGVLSIRDLVKEVVSHHEKVIMDLERERMTMLNPNC
jgi:CBS domain-containing protein